MVNNSGHIPDELDPDKLVLTKDEIEQIFEAIIEKWGKNKKDNLKYIIALKGMKGAIWLTPEPILVRIWSDILIFFNKLLYYNAMMKTKLEYQGDPKKCWAITFGKFKQDLKDGKI
jgi:hypothetical protein